MPRVPARRAFDRTPLAGFRASAHRIAAALVHTFCGQACGHLAHPIRKPLIRRYKHRRINQAARGNAGDETALQAPTAARRGARFSRSSRVAASAHRRFSACFQPRRSRRLFHNFCWQTCGQAEHWAFNPLIRTRQTSGNTCESRCRPEDDIPVSRFISRMPRDIDIGASGIPYSASGLWHPASIHRASRPHGLFHNFCWQACGHPEHPPSNTLIRRHFPETVRNAASRLKSVRRARLTGAVRRRIGRQRARGDNPPQRIFDAAVFHSFCAQTCGYLAPPRAKRLIHRNFSQSSCLRPRRLAQASAMRSGARAARASAYTGACRHRRTCPCRRRAARRRQSG